MATLALGEPVDADIAAHVEQCAECRVELDALRTTVRIARESVATDGAAPSPAVWSRIAAEVASPVPVDPAATSRARRRWVRAGLAVAAAVLVVGAAVGGWAVGRNSGSSGSGGSARAQLTAQPGTAAGAHGTATMHESSDGYRLDLSTAGLPAPSGYYEVWLYDPSINHMVAVGTLGTTASGTFTMPAGIDTRAYHVVDVSLQRYNGDNTHQRSVLRGALVRA